MTPFSSLPPVLAVLPTAALALLVTVYPETSSLATAASTGTATSPDNASSGKDHQELGPLRLMSFNIRYGTARDGADAWPRRRGLVAEVIREFRPGAGGLQEALHFQLVELEELLPAYDWVGVGRDDGAEAGEYAAILYRRDRLEVLDQGTFWFSDTPDIPGSTSWGNDLPRICTWARFRDRTRKETFLHFNVHWDHRSQASRERGAHLLLDRIRRIRRQGEPVVVTGDFNAGEDNPAFRTLLEDPDVPLRDTFRVLHPEEEAVGTFHGFRGDTEGEKIDAVLADPSWNVQEAAIQRWRQAGAYPSDHYPVTAVLGWPSRGEQRDGGSR